MNHLSQFLMDYLAPGTATRGLVLALLTAGILWLAYRYTRKGLELYMTQRAHKPDNVKNFLLLYRYVWMVTAFILVIVSLSGSLGTLGLSAAFVGMILGWSLQAPVTGIAAWLMIILKRPFKIGDRVIIAGIVGDVTDINLTHIVLNQVGGTVGGEEKSGRGVLIPNATLFQQVIYNYTLDAKYILDEVLVRLTFESDFQLAEQICVQAAREVTPQIIEDSGFEPTIRCELFESGVLIRLRYQTEPANRQIISTRITRIILERFKDSQGQVRFCFPHSVVRYKPLGGSVEAEESPTPPIFDKP